MQAPSCVPDLLAIPIGLVKSTAIRAFRRFPALSEGLRAGVGHVLARGAGRRLDAAKTPGETLDRVAQRRLGLDAELAPEVRRREQQVAELVRHGTCVAGFDRSRELTP